MGADIFYLHNMINHGWECIPGAEMYGLFTYMKGEKLPYSRGNVGKYSRPMEHLGMVYFTYMYGIVLAKWNNISPS